MPERILVSAQHIPIERSADKVKISFCTTCCNRTSYLQEVFAENAQIIERDPALEWVIVNFGSRDGLDEFMMNRLEQINPRILYARDAHPKAWHLSIAKNLAHRLGAGDILVNLDCDNLIADAVNRIKIIFRCKVDMLHMWSGTVGDGTCGRIAVRTPTFFRLGGYDESFYPMGYQDWDLLARAHASGFSVFRGGSSNMRYAIPNTKIQSIENCQISGLSWTDYNEKNRQKSDANIKCGRLTANQSGWTATEVELYRGRRHKTVQRCIFGV